MNIETKNQQGGINVGQQNNGAAPAAPPRRTTPIGPREDKATQAASAALQALHNRHDNELRELLELHGKKVAAARALDVQKK